MNSLTIQSTLISKPIPIKDPWKTRDELFGTLQDNNLTNIAVPNKSYVDPELIGTKEPICTSQPTSSNDAYVTRFGRKIKKPDFYQASILNNLLSFLTTK